MKREELKEKTKEKIYACFKNHVLKYGVPPTVREICRKTGIPSTSTVYKYLKILEDEGLVCLEMGKRRTGRIPGMTWEYSLTPPTEARVLVYIKGRVTTGFYAGGKWHVGDRLLDNVDAWLYTPEVRNEKNN